MFCCIAAHVNEAVVQAFKTVRLNGRRKYHMRYVSPDGSPVQTCCGMTLGADGALDTSSTNADLLIPGGQGVDELIKIQAVKTVIQQRAQSEGKTLLISVCSGALVLAAAGV